jgi:hypothetical protein
MAAELPVQETLLPQQRRFFSYAPLGVRGGAIMTTLQAICLGAMLAWTPSLVVLAWLLREAPVDEF